jgi:hypothetical protein
MSPTGHFIPSLLVFSRKNMKQVFGLGLNLENYRSGGKETEDLARGM